jgi:hypothetical protein
MASPAIEKLIESLENDLPRSTVIREKAPALAAAFDAERMKATLQEVLIGSDDYSIVSCVPAKALYLLDHHINMQYKLTIRDNARNQTVNTLINARLFRDPSECKTYLDADRGSNEGSTGDKAVCPSGSGHRAVEDDVIRLSH